MPNLFTDTSTLGVAKYLSEPVEGVFHPFFPYGPFGWDRSRNGTVPGPTTNNKAVAIVSQCHSDICVHFRISDLPTYFYLGALS